MHARAGIGREEAVGQGALMAEKGWNAVCRCEGRGMEGGGMLEGLVLGVALGSK